MLCNMELIEEKYKQTEIGLIPSDWEVKTLGDIGDVKMCKRIFSHQTKEIGEIPFYKIGTFGKEPDAYISMDLYNDFRKKFSYPSKGDILISAAGTIGRTIKFNGEDGYFQDSNIVWIDNKQNLISNEYLHHILQIIKYNTEGGTIQRLYNSILKSTKFVCPTDIEQTLITKTLSDTDDWLKNLEQLLIKKRHIKQAALQEMIKPKEGWETKKLGEICEIKKGKGISKSQLSIDGKYKCILYGELFTTYKEIINNVNSKTNIIDSIVSKEQDILFPGSTTTTGIDLAKASTILENGVLLGGDILILRKRFYNYNSIFLTYFLNVEKKYEIAQNTKGITIHHLYGSDLGRINVQFPELEEQNRIATILTNMDIEIEQLETKLQKAKKVKQGMMQELLTGKIRLV